MLKKLVVVVIVVVIIFAGALAAIRFYMKPTEALDLNYQEVAISGKIADIILSRKLEVQLTEQDMNNLVKKQLAMHRTLPNDFRIEGTKLILQGSTIEADVNVTWHDQVAIGAKMHFKMSWNAPDMEIQLVDAQVKGMRLPNEWLQIPTIEIPLEEHLPKLIGVRDVLFDEKGIRIQLKLLR
ncbi:hypothetical protein [Paenibacillus sp. N3.4]|uniref:hypothetical protein n=1 Tax=Paenibacillus sp. N3.4 TaxID=2603222 RepID=UPI0011CAD6E4|nr:hypothetical protein [Paenibacillus sp. N3.4]TXK72115.1 hypothetical protein FU659_31875 [Paenibacillus sp. N3.4]